MPPSWIMKLTEGWGKAKNDSKGEDDGFKMEEGEGEGRGKILRILLPQGLHRRIRVKTNPT